MEQSRRTTSRQWKRGLRDCIKKGVLAGYPVVGLKATLTDGSYHPVDSSEMSFKMAASIAYKEGLPKASPCILEPIGSLKAYVPDNNTGDLMGELNKTPWACAGNESGRRRLAGNCGRGPMSEMHDSHTDSFHDARTGLTLC